MPAIAKIIGSMSKEMCIKVLTLQKCRKFIKSAYAKA